MPNPPPTSWWRAAVRPRMLGLLLVLLVAAAVCARLGVWQLDRAQVRGAAAEGRRVAALQAADAVPLTSVLAPQTTFTGRLVARKVEATGTYDAAQQLLVTDRVHDGATGLVVITPLRVEVAGQRATLVVARGWVADASDATAPPAGEVRVTGYLQAGEGLGELAGGRTDVISPAQLVSTWGGPIWTGYVVLASSDPEQDAGLALLDLPRRAGTGLNLQNLAYAAQWWIFGGFALLIWWRAVSDEARAPRERAELSA